MLGKGARFSCALRGPSDNPEMEVEIGTRQLDFIDARVVQQTEQDAIFYSVRGRDGFLQRGLRRMGHMQFVNRNI